MTNPYNTGYVKIGLARIIQVVATIMAVMEHPIRTKEDITTTRIVKEPSNHITETIPDTVNMGSRADIITIKTTTITLMMPIAVPALPPRAAPVAFFRLV